MSRLTLRLPESLHRTLVQQAREEGTSLNQTIVYLLTRMTASKELDEERRVFEGLVQRYPAAEAEAALQEILAARTPPDLQDPVSSG